MNRDEPLYKVSVYTRQGTEFTFVTSRGAGEEMRKAWLSALELDNQKYLTFVGTADSADQSQVTFSFIPEDIMAVALYGY